jgi:tRNA (guanine-N7-)-methyltransferase
MRRKGKKQQEVRQLKNVLWGTTEDIAENLKSRDCLEEKKITLELGCGNGEYTLSLSQKFPEKFFIGIDVKGSRIWTGAKYAIENQINNCLFMITRIDRLNLIFPPYSVDEIWIPFPNPFQMRKSIKQRLVHRRFLEVYKKICIPDAKIHLKTDDDILFEYTLQVINEENLKHICSTEDLLSSQLYKDELTITTKFEQQHLNSGKKIKYVCFTL